MTRPDRFWDWIAKRYDKQTRKEQGYDRAVERFARHLRPGDTVLDYACGTGVIAFKIASRVKQVHGVDASARMIELATERARQCEAANLSFTQGTLFDPELETRTYDAMVAFNILHLVEDPRRVLQRAFELLKPRGLLVSSTPCLGEAGFLVRTLVPLTRKVGLLSHLESLRTSEVRDLTRDAGFEILDYEVREEAIPLCFVAARKRRTA